MRVFELYRRLAGRLSEVTVATGRYPDARDEEVDGVRYLRLGAAWPYLWSRASYSLAAGRLLAHADFDVAVYDFSTYTPIRIPPDRPVGITVHHVTGDSATERWGRPIGRLVAAQERRRLRSGRLYSATSRMTYQRLRAILPASAEIRMIQAGVPDELFALSRREADYLLYFGRLDWFQKGLDVLLEAMRMLVQKNPNLRLKVAGRGKDGRKVVERAYDLGIRDNVEVIGPVDDAQRDELFSGAKLLVMPSRFEGFGMVAAEAMAAGVPLVASHAGSLPEVVDAPAGGILVAPGDPRALAAEVEKLLADHRRRRALSGSARRAAERFRWDRVAQQHLDFLEAIHARSTSGASRAPQEI